MTELEQESVWNLSVDELLMVAEGILEEVEKRGNIKRFCVHYTRIPVATAASWLGVDRGLDIPVGIDRGRAKHHGVGGRYAGHRPFPGHTLYL